jgi:L-aspartate oxidase
MDALANATRAAGHVRVIEGLRAIDLYPDESGRAAGLACRDGSGRVVVLRARDIVFATGGSGGLWRVTTNPATALGGGIAMAARLGALIGDPEFVQFHPTAIDVGRDPAPLATEALRGEGARVIDADGAPFMALYDPRGELAPRDVVARAIARQIRTGGGAFLDCRTAVGAAFAERFPTVFAACMSAGIDPRTAPIPVAPAAHYHMGGIVTDLWARTSVENLSAIGECASTGAHGANRLASNSLLESVVFAKRCAERLRDDPGAATSAPIPRPSPPDLAPARRAELRALMQLHCGVERGAEDRSAARDGVRALIDQCDLANDLLAAAFIVEGAARRLESRGGHWTPDHPHTDIKPRRTFLALRDLDLPGAERLP